jgi:hypothetical protein
MVAAAVSPESMPLLGPTIDLRLNTGTGPYVAVLFERGSP